ncbi:hypothetical protein THAR02_09748 [Trichoderma harzianum]|uniref:Uncharacterized protein n=1 Tax=Trichoderma harzianum TaxID=5544 RepID=A0A0F9WYE2_TRIHA|nr:hypothetical protein THAR02_09748 [Trichoderma harzianum]
MPGQRSSSILAANPGNDASSTSATHSQEELTTDATPLEASSIFNPSNAYTEIIEWASYPRAIELHDNPIDDDILPQPECRSPSPPSPTQPSPAFTFAVLDSPPSPSSPVSSPPQLIYPVFTYMPIEERLERRQECEFHLQCFKQGLVEDPFGEWSDLANDLYGGNIPPEFYLTSAPFDLHSLRGRVRLRFIRTAFCMPIDSTIYQIESFLSRNPSLIRYLLYNAVPDPDHAYLYQKYVDNPASREHNRIVLRAIKQLNWIDETVDWMAEVARTEDEGALSELHKVRETEILPTVWKKMQEMEKRKEKWKEMPMEKLHARAVQKMRKDRPNTLLRNVVTSKEVVKSRCRFM